MNAAEKRAKADELAAQATKLREEAYELDQEEGRKRPLADRLCYAATSRCKCGAGLAYDPFASPSPNSPFRLGADAWQCSATLLDTAASGTTHTGPLPFAFYEIKSENQPSANGATTRPA